MGREAFYFVVVVVEKKGRWSCETELNYLELVQFHFCCHLILQFRILYSLNYKLYRMIGSRPQHFIFRMNAGINIQQYCKVNFNEKFLELHLKEQDMLLVADM